MKKSFFIAYTALLVFLCTSFSVREKALDPITDTSSEIQWMTWEQAMENMKTEKRKILVDLYTDWCGWCKRMDQTTFQNREIADYLSRHYYAVKFNGERKEPLTMGDKTYKYIKGKGKRGYHEFALTLAKGRLSYPTFVFLNEDSNILQPIPGYKDARTFEMIMTYFGDNHYKVTPWDQYQEKYVPLKTARLIRD